MGVNRCRIHKYYKVDMLNGKVWACADCTHYMPKHIENLISNKPTICWECGGEMKMGPLQLERDKPICETCMGIDEVTNVELSPDLIARLKAKGLNP